MEIEVTFRIVQLGDENTTGRTAKTPELAQLGAGFLDRSRRVGLERTEWVENYGKPKILRTVLIEAEKVANEWILGEEAA
jgi:hypothetical protein